MKCNCCSGKNFDNCCLPILNDQSKATTPLLLMRSRYTAYTLGDIAYILKTTHISERDFYKPEDVLDFSKNNKWQKLEIIEEKENVVEFKAFFEDSDGDFCVLHERSTFVQENELWYYLSGIHFTE